MVFYRKYRPQTIKELDSKEIRERLFSVFSRDTAHAMLFTGPKGLGKTSAARIVAKVINCEKRQVTINNSQLTKKNKNSQSSIVNSKLSNLEPCNKCDQCISITNGSNIDVLEIDGASNRGIDEIRDLREKIKLSPARARKKVYIIDEVHMLTTEAFNALLKTLEEPPEHVVFILCTTEPHKVPATISSRCFHIPFKRATPEELVRAFSRISKKEKIAVDNDGLLEIAKFSDGSFRDGVKILEELSVLSKRKKITSEFVQKTYQTSDMGKNLDEMIEYFIKRDVKRGVSLVGDLTEKGIDLKYFLESLVSRLHEILLEKVGVLEESTKFTNEIELSDLKELIEKLSSAIGKMKYSVLPQLPLEVAIIEWSIRESENTLPRAVEDAHIDSIKSQSVGRSLSESRHPISIKPEIKTTPSFSSSTGGQNILSELIDKVKSKNHSIAGVLRGCNLKSYDGKKFIIEAKFKFHKEKLEDLKTRRIIEEVLEEITGKNMTVSFVLKS